MRHSALSQRIHRLREVTFAWMRNAECAQRWQWRSRPVSRQRRFDGQKYDDVIWLHFVDPTNEDTELNTEFVHRLTEALWID